MREGVVVRAGRGFRREAGLGGLGARSRGRGRGEEGWGESRFEGARLTRRVPEEPEPVADLSLPAATVREREQQRQRGGPRGKKAGKAGSPGQASHGSPPPSRGLQTLVLPLRPLVGGSVAWWVSGLQLGYRLSGSKVGGPPERPAHLSRLERSSAPRSVGSPHALRPAARSGLRAPAGALPGKRRAPRS